MSSTMPCSSSGLCLCSTGVAHGASGKVAAGSISFRLTPGVPPPGGDAEFHRCPALSPRHLGHADGTYTSRRLLRQKPNPLRVVPLNLPVALVSPACLTEYLDDNRRPATQDAMWIQILLGRARQAPRFLVTARLAYTGGEMRLTTNLAAIGGSGWPLDIGRRLSAFCSSSPFPWFRGAAHRVDALWPFAAHRDSPPPVPAPYRKFVWTVLSGGLAIGHLLSAAAMAITIIGFHWRWQPQTDPVSLMPLVADRPVESANQFAPAAA